VYIKYGLYNPRTGKLFSYHDQLFDAAELSKGFVVGVLARKGSNTTIVRLIVGSLVSNGFVLADKDPVFTGKKARGGGQQELTSKKALPGSSRPSTGTELLLWADYQQKLSENSFASSKLNCSPTCQDAQIPVPSTTMESGGEDMAIPELAPASTKRKTLDPRVPATPVSALKRPKTNTSAAKNYVLPGLTEDESTEVEDPLESMRTEILQLKRTAKSEQQRYARETKKLLSDHAAALRQQQQEHATRLKQHQLEQIAALRQVNQEHAVALRTQKTKCAEDSAPRIAAAGLRTTAAEHKATAAEHMAAAAEGKAALAEQNALAAGRRAAAEVAAAVAQAKSEGALREQALAEARQQQKGMWDMMLHVLPAMARAPPAPAAAASATTHSELDTLERCANILRNFRGGPA
jgi:hypothetical protein